MYLHTVYTSVVHAFAFHVQYIQVICAHMYKYSFTLYILTNAVIMKVWYRVFQVACENQIGNVTQTCDPKFKYLEPTGI